MHQEAYGWFAVQLVLDELSLFMVTHLTLHTFSSASAGAVVRTLGRLLLSLLLQFEVLCVQVLRVSWTLYLLVGLLNTLKGNNTAAIFKNNKLAINVKTMFVLNKKYLNVTLREDCKLKLPCLFKKSFAK